ncbi:alpha/beta hydrolase family protein [Isoalcanivorax indicus]|uniref:alpha/beta hydrolase family protein n=1 Tax=Isoalcanivorax indicus TaxID=2202653 RepID=UPI000DB91037|nr:alpha/beta hydrolase [Isoalcanivorax indicus]
MRIILLFTAMLSLLHCTTLHTEEIRFQSNENTISGIYLPPYPGQKMCGVVVTVHGDGPLDREAYGYYPLIWKLLRSRGYAVMSWDKPGIGDSSGNWLHQTMEDRQQEVLAAIHYLEHRFGPQRPAIGLLGFSQAGWVIPAVANQSQSVAFLIGIGFAINWADQGWYLTKTRLQKEGASPEAIQLAREKHLDHIAFLSGNPTYEAYLNSIPDQKKAMSPDRFTFALNNFQADASSEYPYIEQPLLMLLGKDDLNVDIANTQEFLSSLGQRRRNFQTEVLPDATHSLLNSRHFNTQNPGFLFLVKLHLFGNSALSPLLEPILDQWLADRGCAD